MRTKKKYLIFTLLLGSASVFSAVPERDRLRDRTIDQARSIEHDRTRDQKQERIYDKAEERRINKMESTAQTQLRKKDADVEVTRQLRERLMSENQLSTQAKNIQINTDQDAILLEGPVANREEKVRIENLARSMAGKKKVYNRLTY